MGLASSDYFMALVLRAMSAAFLFIKLISDHYTLIYQSGIAVLSIQKCTLCPSWSWSAVGRRADAHFNVLARMRRSSYLTLRLAASSRGTWLAFIPYLSFVSRRCPPEART